MHVRWKETGNKSHLKQWPYTVKLMIPATTGFGPNQHNENDRRVCEWTSGSQANKKFISPLSVFFAKKKNSASADCLALCVPCKKALQKKTKLKVSCTFLMAMMSFFRERKLNVTKNNFLQLYDSSESYCILNNQIEYFCVRCFNKNSTKNSHGTNLNINKRKKGK
jgi:hypothetical protein